MSASNTHYNQGAAINTVSLSDNDLINGIVYDTRYKSDFGSPLTTITYSFPNSSSQWHFSNTRGYATNGSSEPKSGLESLDTESQQFIRDLLLDVEKFANIAFMEVPDGGSSAGTIRIAWTEIDEASTVAYAFLPGTLPISSDIWLSTRALSTDHATYENTIAHEVGHALGLVHPFDDDAPFTALDSAYDGTDWTVMSYEVSARHPDAVWADLYPSGFMYIDILGLTYLYGDNFNGTSGDDTYTYSQSERYYETIWDTAGVDKIVVNGGSADVQINLTPGSWSNVGTTINYWGKGKDFYEKETLYIPEEATIEHATASGGDDVVIGNDADNLLLGKAGDDTLIGSDGHDTLSGSGGDDFIIGDGGDGGDGDDRGDGNADGEDKLSGGGGDDTLIGGSWDDGLVNDNGVFEFGEAITTNSMSDQIWAGAGDDLLITGAGDDRLGGGPGHDEIYSGAGNDVIFSSSGNDYVQAGAGDDEIFSGSGDDTVSSGSGDDTLWGCAGDDLLTGNEGVDAFIFAVGNGTDTITDFELGEDILNLGAVATNFTDIAAVITASINTEGGLQINTGAGTSIILEGLTVSDIVQMNIDLTSVF